LEQTLHGNLSPISCPIQTRGVQGILWHIRFAWSYFLKTFGSPEPVSDVSGLTLGIEALLRHSLRVSS